MLPLTTIIRRTSGGNFHPTRRRHLRFNQLSTSAQSGTSSSTTSAILYSLTAIFISAGIWSSGYKQGYDLIIGASRAPIQQDVVVKSTLDAVSEEKKQIQEHVVAPAKQDHVVQKPMTTDPTQDATTISKQDTTAKSKDVMANAKQDAIIEKHLSTIAQLEDTSRLQFQEIQKLKKSIEVLVKGVDERNEMLKKQNLAIKKLMKAKNWPETISHRLNRQ